MVESNEKAPIKVFKLCNDRVSVEVDMQGALLKSAIIDDTEVIYKPRENNLGRGGVPILGPTPGPVKDSLWENLYPKMPSHGLDRKTTWTVSEATENEIAFKRIIGPNEFLFVGEILVKIKLLENGVSISKTIVNFEEKPREIGHGFHPYFVVSKNTHFFPDEIENLHPLSSGKAKIIKPGISQIRMAINNGSYEVSASPKPIQTVVWSDNPDLYECIEPWWAEEGRGDLLKPGEHKTYILEIRKVDPS